MATSRSLVLETEDQTGQKAQKSFTAVNPDATINDMIGFAQLIVGLSTNTLKNSSYVEKTPLVAKSSRNITITNASDFTIDGFNLTISKSKFTPSTWQVFFGIAGTGVGATQYSVTTPTIDVEKNDALAIAITPDNSADKALVLLQAIDETITKLQTGEYKILVHGDATYDDEIITVTITE